MKSSTALVILGAVVVGGYFLTRRVTATPQSQEQAFLERYPGGYIPDVVGVNPLASAIQQTPKGKLDTTQYTLSSKVLGTQYGTYSAAEMEALVAGRPVVQDGKVTKVETMTTTLAPGASLQRPAQTQQLITVESVSSKPNIISTAQAAEMNRKLAVANKARYG